MNCAIALALVVVGFDREILGLRSGSIGNLVNLVVGDAGFERVNGKASA